MERSVMTSIHTYIHTHVLPHVLDPFVSIPGYNLIWHDTPGNVAKHGVCVYIRESIQVDSVITPVPNMVCFRLAVFDVYCVVVYRPPSNSPEMNACLLELISDLTRDLMRGGGVQRAPLLVFRQYSNSVGNSALKFSVPLRASILRIL